MQLLNTGCCENIARFEGKENFLDDNTMINEQFHELLCTRVLDPEPVGSGVFALDPDQVRYGVFALIRIRLQSVF